MGEQVTSNYLKGAHSRKDKLMNTTLLKGSYLSKDRLTMTHFLGRAVLFATENLTGLKVLIWVKTDLK